MHIQPDSDIGTLTNANEKYQGCSAHCRTSIVLHTAFYFLKAERNSMGTHFVYVVTFLDAGASLVLSF